MATALQPSPPDHRSSTFDKLPMGMVPGNVHSMSSLPQGLNYTEFNINDAHYSTPTPNRLPKATSDGGAHQTFTNQDYDWNSPIAQAQTRGKDFSGGSTPPPQQYKVRPSTAPREQGPTPTPPIEHMPSQDPGFYLPTQRQSPPASPSPRGLSPTRDYTIPRQSANIGNYYPQSPTNGYPSHQALPSNSSYNASQIPVSPNPRAYAQQPTYITPSPANPVYMKPQAPKEEVCLECAMRDQDMADVDVTSPGAWDRESDVFYADLLHREEESQRTGTLLPVDPNRPPALGDLLTETNLKVHLTMHPREPASRHKNLETYVKAQRLLLEAETLAHARAMQESQQLETKMRDTYSQLRRSAYEVGVQGGSITDDLGGLRIKTPRSASMPSGPPALNSHSREVTLLENGMIMEHVNVKKEEKEERDRRRKEEKQERSRARKSSRGSAADANSVYSTLAPIQPTDSGFTLGQKPGSRYSQSSLRPTSVLSAYGERSPPVPKAYSSAASFSDLHSVTSASSPNRRTRFFGLKNLSGGWRSRDSLAMSGISGSMMDMHVALQQEQNQYPQTVDIGSNAPTLRMGETWPNTAESLQNAQERPDVKSGKKKTGLAKIWGIVTGSSKSDVRSRNGPAPASVKSEDDYPLAPPPPLSYLVAGERGISPRRNVSAPSLPSMGQGYPSSPQTVSVSPPTAPSSVLPSPTSTRMEGTEHRVNGIYDPDQEQHMVDEVMKSKTMPNLTLTQSLPPSGLSPARPNTMFVGREKNLPPLPGESSVTFPSDRPQTMFALDHRQMDDLVPPRAPFRSMDTRRQSFGGLESSGPQNFTYNGTTGQVAGNYNEFGTSRLSLGWWEDSRGARQRGVGSVETTGTSKTASKRRSKFGLSSLFSKKDRGDISMSLDHESALHSMPSSEYETRGFAVPSARMSVTSRKAIQELVDQDPDFVAYRYPSSNDQRLDFFR